MLLLDVAGLDVILADVVLAGGLLLSSCFEEQLREGTQPKQISSELSDVWTSLRCSVDGTCRGPSCS